MTASRRPSYQKFPPVSIVLVDAFVITLARLSRRSSHPVGFASLGPTWQLQSKLAAQVRPLTGCLDRPTVIADDPMADGKAQAGPLPRGLRRVKRFEQVLDRLGCHPASVVGKVQDDVIGLVDQVNVQNMCEVGYPTL